jgi:hypothetical protein
VTVAGPARSANLEEGEHGEGPAVIVLGEVEFDVLERFVPGFRRGGFVEVIL